MGRNHWYTWAFTTAHATALIDLRREAEAEPMLLEAHEKCTRLLGADDERTRNAAKQLVKLYTQLGRDADIATWRTRTGP